MIMYEPLMAIMGIVALVGFVVSVVCIYALIREAIKR